MKALLGVIHAPKGLLYLLRGVKIIFSGWDVAKFAIAPVALNTLVFAAFLMSFNYFAYHISTAIFDQSSKEWYWAALSMITGGALFFVSVIVVIFGFAAAGLIIAAPFNDMLSAAVERKLTGRVRELKMPLWNYYLHVMKNESKKMAVIISLQLMLALVNLVPGFGQLTFAVLSPLFITFVMAFEFTGYTLDRRAFTFRDKRMYLFSRFGLALGFGLAAGLTMVIPIAGFFLMPAATAGGTLLVIENPPEGDR
ncbi:MAG: EI24 domain-containing protein [Nitrospinae bacterium]|nr:EI24 domain-containing protein [Nitrospinota bacterium]